MDDLFPGFCDCFLRKAFYIKKIEQKRIFLLPSSMYHFVSRLNVLQDDFVPCLKKVKRRLIDFFYQIDHKGTLEVYEYVHQILQN